VPDHRCDTGGEAPPFPQAGDVRRYRACRRLAQPAGAGAAGVGATQRMIGSAA